MQDVLCSDSEIALYKQIQQYRTLRRPLQLESSLIKTAQDIVDSIFETKKYKKNMFQKSRYEDAKYYHEFVGQIKAINSNMKNEKVEVTIFDKLLNDAEFKKINEFQYLSIGVAIQSSISHDIIYSVVIADLTNFSTPEKQIANFAIKLPSRSFDRTEFIFILNQYRQIHKKTPLLPDESIQQYIKENSHLFIAKKYADAKAEFSKKYTDKSNFFYFPIEHKNDMSLIFLECAAVANFFTHLLSDDYDRINLELLEDPKEFFLFISFRNSSIKPLFLMKSKEPDLQALDDLDLDDDIMILPSGKRKDNGNNELQGFADEGDIDTDLGLSSGTPGLSPKLRLPTPRKQGGILKIQLSPTTIKPDMDALDSLGDDDYVCDTSNPIFRKSSNPGLEMFHDEEDDPFSEEETPLKPPKSSSSKPELIDFDDSDFGDDTETSGILSPINTKNSLSIQPSPVKKPNMSYLDSLDDDEGEEKPLNYSFRKSSNPVLDLFSEKKKDAKPIITNDFDDDDDDFSDLKPGNISIKLPNPTLKPQLPQFSDSDDDGDY